MSDTKFSIVTQIKNQEIRIYEWMLYHLKEGFDTFIIFDDFSEDGSVDEIKRFKKDNKNCLVIIEQTDGIGGSYNIEQCKNSESYGGDITFTDRLIRSYSKGVKISYELNNYSICAIIDVDEFLVSNSEKKITEILEENFIGDVEQIFVYNFDVLDNYKLEMNLTTQEEYYYRWKFADMDEHSVWRTRSKSIINCLNSQNYIVLNMHNYYHPDYVKSVEFRDYQNLRLHHYRKPNLPSGGSIGFEVDNTIKIKMGKISDGSGV